MARVDPYLADQIAKFWRWWAQENPRLRAELDAGGPGRIYAAVASRLGRVDRKLAWEITPGNQARYRLAVRPLGDPDLRHVARLWLEAAPRTDFTWEYATLRAPNATSEIFELATLDGELMAIDDLDDDLEELKAAGVVIERVSMSDLRVAPSWDPDRERADLRFWHSAFASIEPEDAFEIARQTIGAALGDEAELRWLGEVRADPSLADPTLANGIALPELLEWVDRQSQGATGQRWVTERRRDQKGRHVAVRYNAAQKPMDLPPKASGLAVTLQRSVADVEAPETHEVLALIDDLVANLDPATVRMIEVSEASRLTVFFISADRGVDQRAARAWERRHPKVDARLAVQRPSRWMQQMGLAALGQGRNVAWEAAPSIRTRGDGRLYRRARWIERHPRRLFAGPLFMAVGVLIVAMAEPSLSREAARLLIGLAGVTAFLIATYQAASTYVTMRDHRVLGWIALLFDGWKILVIYVISLGLIVIAVDEMLS